jgi:D-3-phosphoglycerate dehydrogenase
MAQILISENIRGAAVDALAARFNVVSRPELWRDPAALAAALKDVDALIIRNQTRITPQVLDAAPKLRVIGRAGVGLDNVHLAACRERGITIASTPEQNAISVAELAMGLMLSLARFIPVAAADTKSGGWNRQKFTGTELYGKTLGLVGAGKIGFLTAMRARAFGMNVIAYDPYVSRDSVYLAEIGAQLVPLAELMARADVVSCHLPATPQTLGVLDAKCFAAMKPTAYFINTSRGEVVNESDLCAALKAGKLAGAALDVRSQEPPVVGELESLPNVILVPHIAALTREAQERVTVSICNDVGRVLDGLAPVNLVR